MKKLLAIAGITAALLTETSAQCFTLRDVVSNGTIQADPSPGSWGTLLFIGVGTDVEPPYPMNYRKFSWDLGRLVHGTFRAYGYPYDDPNTPNVNEAAIPLWWKNEYIAPCYHGVITTRFSECDIDMVSDYLNTEILREFVLQVTLYDAITKKYINTAYLRWTR